MAARSTKIKAFTHGIHNLASDELIPQSAASESLGWITRDGKLELSRGRQAQGAEGAAGKVLAEHTGFKVNGDSVRFRKVWTGSQGKVQYLNGSTWTDVITNLSNEYVTFSNYASLAGNFVYVTGPTDGIYKIVTANPGNFADVYLSTKNFKGWSIIDKGRMFMWGLPNDKTGLYGSWIDGQDGAVYTTVASEALASVASGTLAFKAGGARRTCFGVQITHTGSGQIYRDNFDGTLTGSAGGTGTINYMTGAFTTNETGAGTADYQWEDVTNKGVADFSKSGTRLAGEGFSVRQDQGGDRIQTVIPFDGSYFSIKRYSVYQFTLDAEDINPRNELIRTDIGIETPQAAAATSAGIMILNTGNPSRPMINIIQRNPVGDNFITTPMFPQFDFSDYNYDKVVLFTWDKYLIISCRTNTPENDTLLFCDTIEKTVDVLPYGGSAFSKADGFLYMGDPNAQTSYEMLTGFDDMGIAINNHWMSKAETYDTDVLKKVKRLRFTGLISADQVVKVSVSLENGDWQWVGTIRGDGDYVDYTQAYQIGGSFIGDDQIGGDDDNQLVYEYLMEIKIRLPKFRSRKIKFEATGIGYVAIQDVTDFDIWLYQDKLPKQYRQKQNVSRDGTQTNLPEPVN